MESEILPDNGLHWLVGINHSGGEITCFMLEVSEVQYIIEVLTFAIR